MIWKVKWRDSARKELRKLDGAAQQKILKYLRNRIATDEDPKRFGKALTSNWKGLWRYRIGDYRLICQIEEDGLTVLVVVVGHRKDVYE